MDTSVNTPVPDLMVSKYLFIVIIDYCTRLTGDDIIKETLAVISTSLLCLGPLCLSHVAKHLVQEQRGEVKDVVGGVRVPGVVEQRLHLTDSPWEINPCVCDIDGHHSVCGRDLVKWNMAPTA